MFKAAFLTRTARFEDICSYPTNGTLALESLYPANLVEFAQANYTTIVDGNQLFLWEKMSAYLALFLEDKWLLAQLLQAEAIHFSKQQINAGWHSVDISARAMASALVLYHLA